MDCSKEFIEEFVDLIELEDSPNIMKVEFTDDMWDSLRLMTMIALIDEHFEVNLNAGDIRNCRNLEAMLTLVEEKKG